MLYLTIIEESNLNTGVSKFNINIKSVLRANNQLIVPFSSQKIVSMLVL